MTTKRAGEAATVGFYFNTRTWELDLHRSDGSALPGGNSDVYVRVPALALLFLHRGRAHRRRDLLVQPLDNGPRRPGWRHDTEPG